MEIIPLIKLYSEETGKDPFGENKTPYSVDYVLWLEKQVYWALKKKRKPTAKKEIEPWRKSFDVYKKETIFAIAEIVKDPNKMAELQRIIPDGYDAQLTLKKSLREYWLTEDGWNKKKYAKGNPDWWATCRNIVRARFNWVSSEDTEIMGVAA